MLKSFYGQEIEISFIKDIFSIGATLFAALIAISLFNDWKVQETFNRTQRLHDEGVDVILKTTKKLNQLATEIEINRLRFTEDRLTEEQMNEIGIEFNTLVKEIIIYVQDLTHDIGVKIALDYSKIIRNNDEELNFVFNTIMEIKVFVQQIAHDRGINENNILKIQNFISNLNLKIDEKLQDRNKRK
ncbi:hypothetical protein QDT66_10700 [Acinetobacter baumannii]|nr:hypothetical protein [Acinetobacter baumannii]MDH2589165.1 hypothetical protein [Acinetobacter baumannii]